MSEVLPVLLFVAMLVTLGVLVAGITLMARGGDANTKYGNRLMQWRVWAQGVALAIFALMLLTR